MQTSDILTRASGGVMMLAAIWNGIFAFFMFAATILMCVGVWWLVPFCMAFIEFFVGLAMVIMGHKVRPIAFSPFFGLIVSLANLNFMGLFMDMVAIGLGVGGFVTYDAELNED